MDVSKHLPLSEASYYVLLALRVPRHGYAVMQEVEGSSGGAVHIGPGTLYGAFVTLEKQALIEKVREEDRRKVYQLTPRGEAVLAAQLERLRLMVNAAYKEGV